MSTITKESITDTIEGLEHLANSGIQSVYIDMAIAGMRRLLASLEAEAVAFVMADDLKDSSIISTPAYRDLGEAMERAVGDVVALYAIHPAPASLDAGDRLSNFIASQESLSGDFEKVLAENIEELYVPSKSATTAPVSVPDEMTPKQASRSYCGEVRGYRDGWNACRAAMLQGADGNSPDGWVACSDRMPTKQDGTVFLTWNSQYIGKELFLMGSFQCLKPEIITHWMPLPAAPQQEVK